jgi:glycosyltransferase involved in cell wall biosynthesis
MSKRILIVMPNPCLPPKGADEKNRFGIIRMFQELGYDVTIITKSNQPEINLDEIARTYQVKISQHPYRLRSQRKLAYYLQRLINPYRWDGAADEYFDKSFWKVIQEEVKMLRPDVILFEYTFLWPIIDALHDFQGPILIRSHNFEPVHFLSEDGVTPINILKFMAKIITEYKAGRVADTLCAITPDEARQYKLFCAKHVITLHSGYLPLLLDRNAHTVKDSAGPLKLLFMGASYNIPHNRRAARFLIEELMPIIEQRIPRSFELYITGGKLPISLEQKAVGAIKYLGYVEDLNALLETVDIILVPHIAGHGMQLKVFEPLVLGMPVVTSRDVLGGYSFLSGNGVVIARNTDEYVEALIGLKNFEKRRNLGSQARAISEKLFSRTQTHDVLSKALDHE